VPKWCLPRIVSNSEVYGVFKKGHVLEGIPIAGLIGDQQAALVGNKCLTKGDAKNTYGALRPPLPPLSSLSFLRSATFSLTLLHAVRRHRLLHALQHGHRHRQVDSRPRHDRASLLARPPLAPLEPVLTRSRTPAAQVGYKMGPQSPMHYALEGSIAVGGSSVTWCVPLSLAHRRWARSSCSPSACVSERTH